MSCRQAIAKQTFESANTKRTLLEYQHESSMNIYLHRTRRLCAQGGILLCNGQDRYLDLDRKSSYKVSMTWKTMVTSFMTRSSAFSLPPSFC